MSMKRGIFYTFVTQAPTLLLFFVSSTLMTRILGDEGRGAYALITNQVALFSMLLSINIGFGVSYFTSKNGAERSVIGTGATLLFINIALTPLILLGVRSSAPLTAILMPNEAVHWLYWGYVYLSIILAMLNGTIAAVLLGLKEFKVLNWMSIFNAALSAIGFTLLYFFKDRIGPGTELSAVLTVTIVILLLVSVMWCVMYTVLVGMPVLPIWSWKIIRPIIAFSLVGHLSNLINLVNYRFDVWVVDQYHGASALGLYAVAVGVGQLLFYVPEPFSRVVQPYLYGQRKDELLPRFKMVARLNFSAVLVLSVGLAFMAPWLIPILFGDVFGSSVTALWLLLPGILFSSAFKLLAQLVVQGGGQRFNLLATSIGALVTILLDLALIPLWGIEGAAIASTISYLSILVAVLSVIRYRLGIPVHDLFLVRYSDLGSLRTSAPWKQAR